MAVEPSEFRQAKGQFFSLEPLSTDRDGWITAVAVTIEGIRGGDGRRRTDRVPYRVLASVTGLRGALPTLWIASPGDSEIQHMNIYHARAICPFTSTRLPEICWGSTGVAWNRESVSHRTLSNFLEATRQVLANANPNSRAR